ncbi:MAG: ParB N-terminal domain-containing protein [Hyphomicrobiaceae bacterium]
MGTNRYAYSDNDPINKSDANGHQTGAYSPGPFPSSNFGVFALDAMLDSLATIGNAVANPAIGALSALSPHMGTIDNAAMTSRGFGPPGAIVSAQAVALSRAIALANQLRSLSIANAQVAVATRQLSINPHSLLSRQLSVEMSKNKVSRLTKSMNKEGFRANEPIKAVEVDGKLVIEDGHHRAEAAKRARIDSVPVVVRAPVNKAEANALFGQVAEAAAERSGRLSGILGALGGFGSLGDGGSSDAR